MPDDAVYEVQLVTPERVLLAGAATEVVLRTAEGDITFLAGSAPLVGSVEPGVLRVGRPDGSTERVATHGGFVQVEWGVTLDAGGEQGQAGPTPDRGSRITLLIGVAELAEEIDVARAQAALEHARTRLGELSGAGGRAEDERPDLELVEAEAAVRRAEVRIEATEAPTGVTA